MATAIMLLREHSIIADGGPADSSGECRTAPAGITLWDSIQGFWYYGSYGYGYQYSVGEPSDLSGIKFDLDQIPKDERKAVENGNVLLDGDGATNGRVKNFSGLGRGKVLLHGPGDHDITVRIKGGQEIAMSVAVRAGHVTHIALNFDQARKDGQQPADVSLEKPGSTSSWRNTW